MWISRYVCLSMIKPAKLSSQKLLRSVTTQSILNGISRKEFCSLSKTATMLNQNSYGAAFRNAQHCACPVKSRGLQ